MSPKFRASVTIYENSGGGIGGLCFAVALSRFPNVRVDVYEAAAQFKEIGAGVMIWAKTWRILQLLDLDKEASKIAHAPPSSAPGKKNPYSSSRKKVITRVRRSDQPTEGIRFLLAEMPYGCIRFHRAEFLDIFIRRLPEGVAHFHKRVVSYKQETPNGPIQMYFDDQSTAICDVLVGCDGIKSMVRAEMFRGLAEKTGQNEYLEVIEPIFSGTIAYRGLIPVHDMPTYTDGKPHRTIQSPMMYCGKNKHVVSYSISQGSVVNVVTFASDPSKEGTSYEGQWVTEVSQQELLDCYSPWEPEVESMLKCIHSPTRWAIHQLKPLPTYVDGRVALLGDAAHAMTPHQGAGAGQAIEDAYVLSELLGSHLTTLDTLVEALKVYEDVRKPVASHVLLGSQNAGRLYEFNGPPADHYPALAECISKQWDWMWASTPEKDVEHALSLLQAKLNDSQTL
ncbi:hypothetical protein Clacol_006841 [Clathrus columnatus]|uniref:FAD-binding domain-containing protein n=1 Tax=Clathrus columnatus TaxID=1419009 RepID=A0AAV5AIT2_9AGAM|nr:hypothetical protein Clacol_006841 [Clathrus columnatus]